MTQEHRKVCPKCLKKKSLTEFKRKPNGSPHSYCIPCEIGYMNIYNANRYKSPEARETELKRGVDKYQTNIKPARIARKKILIDLLGGECKICGYKRSAAALDFNHVDGKPTKGRTISHLLAVQQPWAWEMALREVQKCELLCANCHREKTYPGHELEES